MSGVIKLQCASLSPFCKEHMFSSFRCKKNIIFFVKSVAFRCFKIADFFRTFHTFLTVQKNCGLLGMEVKVEKSVKRIGFQLSIYKQLICVYRYNKCLAENCFNSWSCKRLLASPITCGVRFENHKK